MKHTIILGLIASVLIPFTLARPASASGFATLEISPVSKRFALEPGEVKEGTINIRNGDTEAMTVSVYATPYSGGNNDDALDFETQTTYTQLSKRITIEDADGSVKEKAEIALAPEETKTVAYRITVPEDVASGGQYATIFVESNPNTSEGGIQTISRAGMILYTAVSGETRREAKIADMETSVVAVSDSIYVKATVENRGNIDFQIAIDMTVSSIFGKQLYQKETLVTALPEEEKLVTAQWGDTPRLGLFKLSYEVRALDITMTGWKLVLVLSPVLLGLGIILSLVLVFSVVYLVKAHTKRETTDIVIG